MDTNLTISTTEAESRSLVSRVYAWMCGGLAVTGWLAWYIGSRPELAMSVVSNRVLFYGLVIGEFALVIALSGWVSRMTAGAATLAFLVYSAFNGVTLS